MKQGTLNRKQYDRIRKMDHKQMQDYFNEVRQSGFEAGVKAVSENQKTPELIGLEERLLEIRGIGGAKARSICEVVKTFLDRKESGADEAGSEISGK